jgi:hypothetical protein
MDTELLGGGIAIFTILIIVVSFAFAIGLTVFIMKKVGNMMGGSPEKRAKAQKLVETGAKARATIMAIQPTGMIVNHLNIGCNVTFRLDPLDGSQSFQASKQVFINQTQMPRIGDIWPAWYDQSNPAEFAVGQPQLGDPSTIPVFREFGIPHPFDTSAAAQAQAAPAAPGAPSAGADRVADLSRLGDLHRQGVLSDAEFEAEKARLLGS